ncbi:MAG: DNA internalization-related competence protein ComEC/Rec2 [Lachnospiraceae bacterium]
MKRPLFMLCLTIVMGVALYLWIHPPADFSYGEVAGEEVCFTGQVYRKEFQRGQNGPVLLLYLKPEELRFHQQNIPFENNFICVLQSGSMEPPIGSRVMLTGILQEYGHAKNPGEFDAKDYYAAIGISARITNCRIQAADMKESLLSEKIWQLRCCLSNVLDDIFEENTAAFLKGMLLGEKSGLDTQTKDLYKRAGVLHIMAISGVHISLMGMGLYQLLRRLYVPAVPAAVCCGMIMLLYGVMVGFPVSAVRAIGMFLLRLLAKCTGRTYDMQTALLLCAACILLENPLYLYHAGFWLSFSAVLALCILKPALVPEERVLHPVADSILTSFSVAVFTLPVQLFFYYEVSVYAALWNLAVIPLAGICLSTAVVAVITFFFTPSLGGLPTLCATAIILFYEKGSRLIGELPQNTWRPGKPDNWQVVFFLLLMGVVLFLKKLTLRHKVGLLCGAILLLGMDMRTGLEITFLNVGQGDCICISLPDGTTWLCDGGSSDRTNIGQYCIEPFLKYEGIDVLDAVFLSHPDSDHTNGVRELLQRDSVEIKLLVLPCTERNTTEEKETQNSEKETRNSGEEIRNSGEKTRNSGEEITNSGDIGAAAGSGFAELLYLAKEKDIPILWLEAGMEWRSGDVAAQCLHPAAGFVAEDRNAASEVLYITYMDFSLLLTGDVEEEGEEALLAELKLQGIENVTVLKVAHHGSRYSTTEELLEQIKPRLAVISCGENNFYGHPHRETLERLEEAGTVVYRIDEMGAIEMRLKEGRIEIVGYRK